MIRRFSSSSSFTLSPLLVPCTSTTSSIRTYITQQYRHRERSLMSEEHLEILGFSRNEATPSKQQLAIAFKKELANIMEETAAMISESNSNNSNSSYSPFSEVSKEGSWNHIVENRTMVTQTPKMETGDKSLRDKLVGALRKECNNNSPTGDGDQKIFSDPEKIMKVRDERVAKLVDAFRKLNNSRYQYLYDSELSVTPEVMLGHKRSDEQFANFDSRRQEFFFSKKEAKPLSDFTDAYRQTIGTEDGDMEGISEIANQTSGVAGLDPETDNIRGTEIQFTLRLAFLEAFTGCTKVISFRRRTSCRFCTGSGFRRKKTQRCPQCAGRGQLQLPSGSALIEKNCSLCLGSGSTLPPECSACKGTGLGPVENCKQTINVPPGVSDGDSMNLREKGHAGARGGEAGNCYVTIVVQPHRYFHRDENDLHVIVPVHLSVILAGGEIQVPVLDDAAATKKISVEVGRDNNNTTNTSSISSSGTAKEEENNNNKNENSQDNSFASFPMMTDRLIILPEYGMWKEGPVGRDGDMQMVRGSLYVHCVGVTPRFDELTKRQRSVILDHFGGLKEHQRHKDFSLYGNDVNGNHEGDPRKKMTDSDEEMKRKFSELAYAKEMCKHWLPSTEY